MKDIGYSGQYLDDKEFRIKFRTGGDILNATHDAIAGEIFLVTGANPSVYVCTKTVTEQSPAEIYKIGDLTDLVGQSADTDGDGVPNNLDAFPNDSSETSDIDGDGIGDNVDDSDGDGVVDALDYFYLDDVETYTKAELEGLSFDPTSNIASWDYIKFITNEGNPEAHPGMIPGEFYLIGDEEQNGWKVMGRDGSQVDSNGNVLRVYSIDRGTTWEKII